MSLPQLLLVDDSEAILAYEAAILSSHYRLATATTGADALDQARRLRPDCVLLDLAMPEMDGEQVLARLQGEEELRDIPVIIVSTQTDRAEACLKAGATAFLAKPIRKDELVAIVGRVLDEAGARRRAGGIAVLSLTVGSLRFAVPIECVRAVVLQPATVPLGVGPFYMNEMFVLYGDPVLVLDVAQRLGVRHVEEVVDRKVVIVDHGGQTLALSVDQVRDAEQYTQAQVTLPETLGGTDHRPLRDALVAVVNTSLGPLPVVDPRAFVSFEKLRALGAHLRAVQADTLERGPESS